MHTKPTVIAGAPYLSQLMAAGCFGLVSIVLAFACVWSGVPSKGHVLLLVFSLGVLGVAIWVLIRQPIERTVTLGDKDDAIVVKRVWIGGRTQERQYVPSEFCSVISYLSSGGSSGSSLRNYVVLSDKSKSRGLLLDEYWPLLSDGFSLQSKWLEDPEATKLRNLVAQIYGYENTGFFRSTSEFCDFGFQWID